MIWFRLLLMMSGVAVIKGEVALVPTDTPKKCESLQVQECNQLGCNLTYIPNQRGHKSQEEAYKEFKDFLPLVLNKCSNAILHFLCSFYFPICFSISGSTQIMRLNPCRSLCEYVEPSCTKLLNQANFMWPAFFNCSIEHSFAIGSTLCFGQDNLSTINIPGYIFLLNSIPITTVTNNTSLVSAMWLIYLLVFLIYIFL